MLKAILSISLKASGTFQSEENLYLQMKSNSDETIFCKILCTGIAGEGEGCRRAVIHFNREFHYQEACWLSHSCHGINSPFWDLVFFLLSWCRFLSLRFKSNCLCCRSLLLFFHADYFHWISCKILQKFREKCRHWQLVKQKEQNSCLFLK